MVLVTTIFHGGAGSDTLIGGFSDTIDGGEGADVAVFAGLKVITRLRLRKMD